MKAIANTHSSIFFNTASAGPLTSAWSAPFLAKARCSESVNSRAARRQLRCIEAETHSWQEAAARVALVFAMISAYATAIWQIGSF